MTFQDIMSQGILGVLFLSDAESNSLALLVLRVALCAILPLAVGYLLGSVSTAVLVSKTLFKEDVRERGSHNAGMTNVMRNYGSKPAIITFVGDVLKTGLAMFLGRLLLGESGLYLAALGAMVGHIYPLFFGFKGGKGVACLAGLVLFSEPLLALLLFCIFCVIVGCSKFISLGSIMVALIYPLFLNRWYILMHPTTGVPFPITLVSFCVMVIIIVKHRENIQRLMKGKENKFSFKKSEKPKTSAENENGNGAEQK